MNTIRQLRDELAEAGVRPRGVLMVHSSLKRIGETEQGAEGVLAALREVLGPEGLLVFPAQTYTLAHIHDPGSDRCRRCGYPARFCLARGLPLEAPRCFHAASTPACVGVLPNVFLKTPGVCRSLHPLYSVAAVGPGAAEFVAGHEQCDSGYGPGSPWEKLAERGAQVLLAGVGLEVLSFLHFVAGREPIRTLRANCMCSTVTGGRCRFPRSAGRSGTPPRFLNCSRYWKRPGRFGRAGSARHPRCWWSVARLWRQFEHSRETAGKRRNSIVPNIINNCNFLYISS